MNIFNIDKNVTVYKNTILNYKIEEVDWYEKKIQEILFFKEKSKHFIDIIPIKRTTIDLDTIVINNNILRCENNIFIKIDSQGAEIPILKGTSLILGKTDFILLEIPLFGQYNENVLNFLEHIKFMDSIDFIPYDIIENHYKNGFNIQIDILFINKSHKFNIDRSKRKLYTIL